MTAPAVADLEAASAATAAAIADPDATLAGVCAAAEAGEAACSQVFTGPCDTPAPEATDPEPEMEAAL